MCCTWDATWKALTISVCPRMAAITIYRINPNPRLAQFPMERMAALRAKLVDWGLGIGDWGLGD